MSGFGGFKLKFQVLHSNLKVMVNFNHIFRTWCVRCTELWEKIRFFTIRVKIISSETIRDSFKLPLLESM